MDVILYTDGSARGNPNGPGGYGAVLQFIDAKGQLHEREYSQGYIKTTNNRMELMAAIVGLEALIKPCNVKLYSDSQYLCNAFNQHWIEGWIKKGWKRGKNEPVKNRDLWERLLAAKAPHNVEFLWVKGHAGISGNVRCDMLATAAADGDAAHCPADAGADAGKAREFQSCWRSALQTMGKCVAAFNGAVPRRRGRKSKKSRGPASSHIHP